PAGGPPPARARARADDDVVTREYRDGDALRRVHWRVTARQGELMVRQDEPQAGPHARLVVDAQSIGYRDTQLVRDRQARAARAVSSATFEWTVRMAASAAVHLAERGYTVELATPTERTADAPVADGPVGDVLGELALLELGAPAGELPERPAPGSPPVVVIASAPDDQTVRWMLAQRSGRAPAVALLAGPAAPGVRADGLLDPDPVRDSFERAGWAVARVSIRRAPDEAWLALLGEQLGELPDWALPAVVHRG
ncbi:DUF58 domain-containing protein, partial [Microcella sp.]|uniref:DUF58 domain-containing protein n=1 Tax=Microcella sp. TaxID=1913979 RepID=UPI00391C04ED